MSSSIDINVATGEVVESEYIDTRTDSDRLEAAKLAKWIEIKADRDLAERGGFTFNGMMFDCDEVGSRRIGDAALIALMAQLAGRPFLIDWTLADNTVVSLDGDGMISVGTALGSHVANVFERGRLLRSEISSSLSLTELMSIKW